ncbi:hypothetical protein [Zooshikella ganghwensis]|uniref:Uncharacterized protein n=1 Tax=Zooshikella ganghwensis TaxID=202772 RepID=A0A4P9VLJ8_9GAMM|nr:hypothetical protein [Zooshikella ganghwensis]RDH43686.1 hypothetical protein B9G39_09675 [Zooshikella ganghwensis]
MDDMPLKLHEKYFLSINDDDITLDKYSEVVGKIERALNEPTGKLSLAADDGLRPWWQRFVFGSERYVRSYLMYEWSGNVSGLIFHDENASEYRAMPGTQLNGLPERDKSQITFGEGVPLETRFCMSKEESLKAISEFLKTGKKPSWLKYEFVR